MHLPKKQCMLLGTILLFSINIHSQFKFSEKIPEQKKINLSEYAKYYGLKDSLKKEENEKKLNKYYLIIDYLNSKGTKNILQLKKDSLILINYIHESIRFRNEPTQFDKKTIEYHKVLNSLISKTIESNPDTILKLRKDSLTLRTKIDAYLKPKKNPSDYEKALINYYQKIDVLSLRESKIKYKTILKYKADSINFKLNQKINNILTLKEKYWTAIMNDLENKIRKKKADKNLRVEEKKIKTLKGETLTEPEIKAFTRDLKSFDKKIDSLKGLLKIETEKLDITFFKRRRFVFGLRSAHAIEVFRLAYDKDESFQILNNSGLNIGGGASSVYSEIITDRVGPVRIGFGAMVTKSQNDSLSTTASRDEALQKVLTYGGNTVLTIDYPLFWSSSASNNSRAVGFLSLKGAADLPELGAQTDNFSGNFSTGLDIYGELSTDRKLFKLFANISSRYYFGSDSFRDNLEIDEKNFGLITMRFGLLIDNSISISLLPIIISTSKKFEKSSAILSVNIN